MTAILLALLLASTPDTPRIQRHLQTVEAELRAADHDLAPEQAARRGLLLDALHDYWQAGVFPRNTVLPYRNPIFVDPWGVRCAMAHLIEVSGGGDLVARVAATRNTAYIRELAGDGELRAWLAAHGLTHAEAARIQPGYDPTATGGYCWNHGSCASLRCLQADPQGGYCTEPCDPAAPGACPDGPTGEPMICTTPAGAPEPLCTYAGPAPGAAGWPCADDPYACRDTCLVDEPEPTCTYHCGSSADCPDGYACTTQGQDQLCIERASDPGCATATARTSPATTVLTLLALLVVARRRAGRSS